jgi:hypothetical protein
MHAILLFLNYEYQRRREEWDFDQLKQEFTLALAKCEEMKDSNGLRWTAV